MGLFKKSNPRKDAGIEPPRAPIAPADPGTVYHRTMDLQNEIRILLSQYNTIANDQGLNQEQYRKLMSEFQILALEFEKIYELMKFDMEKLEEIHKYIDRSGTKRQQLVQQLNEMPATMEKQTIPENADKQAKKGS